VDFLLSINDCVSLRVVLSKIPAKRVKKIGGVVFICCVEQIQTQTHI